jgi:dTDP-4-amino-4,6-dideoxygalactose transaminase
MRVPFLALSRRVEALRPELDEAIAAVLDGARFVGGEPVQAFERELAAYCGAAHAVGVASGTDAIELALRACGVGPGDEVVTAANTCVPTVAAIEAAGATPVLVDVDEASFTLDPAALPAALTERTRAIIPVHLYGQTAELAPISAFAREHGLRVVEDAAQAHGAEYEGARAGTLGDAAAFSFYPTKNLGALGDGGAVVTDDPELAERVRRLREYGETRRHESVTAGVNSRLDTVQAAVLSVGLRHLEAWNDRRRRLADLYAEALAGLELVLPQELPGRRHVRHLYVVRAPDRAAVQARLEEAGVESLVHYPLPIHRQPAYRRLAHEGLEGSERLAEEVLSLPLYPELADGELELVASALRDELPFRF